ncbi:thrombospondin type 1 domain protein [Ancylostoma caninum]|uniref:Thrombospondin type 1 domain protein n=1 Tax=Ancylostoma caninum TaxID=29170 RepID=A0A368FD70_ANCCA|nr:thrombospondin type 1 domain protein [Ancylostoma caninum]
MSLIVANFGFLAAQTPEPEWAPTGKLNQFRGFVTPRPLPPNAEFVYASVWAAWSAWSFCTNGVRMRVRACNTVRGFNCLGPNKEFKPCDPSVRHSHHNPSAPSDYDVVDPYEADRREAMRQLYPDDFPAAEEQNNPNFVKLSKPESGGFRVHAAEPISESSVIDITKVAGVPTVDVQSLEAKPQVGSVDSSKEVFKWVENPEYDWTVLDNIQKPSLSSVRAEPNPGPEPVASTSPVPSLLLPTEKVGANEEQVFIAITTPRYVYPWLEDPLFDDNLAKGVYGSVYGIPKPLNGDQ